jgi:hypothetical protein
VPDTDTDADGTPDCYDGCPVDPLKISPGICGCGVIDSTTDSDGDGVYDCVDQCPGIPDTDTDGDGTPDCIDLCPTDPNKTAPGSCGCFAAETDTDGDGAADCVDGCPDNPLRQDFNYVNCDFASPNDCNYILISCDGVSSPECLPYCVVDGMYYNPCDGCPPESLAGIRYFLKLQ